MDWISDRQHFDKLKEKHDFLVVFFYGAFSEPAQRALLELEEFNRENEDVPAFGIDVQKVKGLHKEFGVENVPTVVVLQKGAVAQFLEGVKSARFYDVAVAGLAPARPGKKSQKRPKRVVVYTGPGCPPCGLLKAHLRRHGVAFREVDISRDQRAAQKLVRRSGQMAVPQTDIDGRLVVGFDRARLDRLLGIHSERSE